MGYTGYSSTAFHTYRTTHIDGKTTAKVFSRGTIDKDLDPKNIVVRESRDSETHPESNAIIIGLDVTGSMGIIADKMAREGLHTLVNEIIERKPVTDPHIMCMGIGDAEMGDSAPLQVTQFETDVTMLEQLTKIYLEHGGGGNYYESYILPWYFAALKTSIDCFEKRGKKGYLFTIGDEEPTPYLTPDDIERVLGERPESNKNIPFDTVFDMVSKYYNVFHIIVAEGSHYRVFPERTRDAWIEKLGQRAIVLKDYTKLAEVIVSTIQVCEGENADKVVNSWDGSTSVIIKDAIKNIKDLTILDTMDKVVRF